MSIQRSRDEYRQITKGLINLFRLDLVSFVLKSLAKRQGFSQQNALDFSYHDDTPSI